MRELAKSMQVHHTLLSRWESGQRRLTAEMAGRLDAELGTAGELAAAVVQLPVNGEAKPSSGRAPRAAVAQLPPVEKLVDRTSLLEIITTEVGQAVPPGVSSPRTVVLTGPGGIGKTAVAVAAATRLRPDYDGILWADMRAWDASTGPRSVTTVLRSWCAVATGIPVVDLPNDLDDLIGLWRSSLLQSRYIIGVDNARSEQISPLIPASPGSVVLITSRDRVPTVPGQVRLLPVPPLELQDATTLIASRAHQPPHRVARLAARGSGLPLALRSLGDYVAAHNGNQEMIEEMSADPAPPDAVRGTARASYRHLTDEQAKAWRLCAILPHVTPDSAAAVSGLDVQQARSLLNAVADMSLLTKHGREWIYHELHRAFALEESQRVDSRAVRDSAAERGLTYQLHGWANASVMLAPDRAIGPPLDPPPPTVRPPAFDSYEAALNWAESRWEYLPISVRTAIDKGWNRMAWQLVAAAFNYIILAKTYEKAYELAQTVITVCERSETVEGLAWMLHGLGYIDTERRDLDSAVRHMERALELRRRRGDLRDVGWSAQVLGRALLLRGDAPNSASAVLTESVDALDSIGATSGAASARSLRGTLYLATGKLDNATADLNKAVEDLPIGGDPLLHCYAYTRLAEARLHQQHPGEAVELAEHAAEYAREHTARFSEVDALDVLGQAQKARGEFDHAARAWQRAIQLADHIGDPSADRLQDQLDELPNNS